MGSVSQIRWPSSQQRALEALQKNLVIIDMPLETVLGETRNTKAKGYLKDMCSVKFVKTLNYWLDVIDILTGVSKKF